MSPARPVESHSGARETILVGPYHNFRIRAESEASRGMKRGEGCPRPSSSN